MEKIKIIDKVKVLLMWIMWLLMHPLNINASQLEIQEEAQNFLQHLDKEKYDIAFEQFDKTMKSALPEKKLKAMWEDIIANYGQLKSFGDSKVFEEAGYQIVLQTCNFEKGKLEAQIAFDKNQQIVGLYFSPTPPAEIYSPQVVTVFFDTTTINKGG